MRAIDEIILLLLSYIDEPIGPFKRIQKLLYIGKNPGALPSSDLSQDNPVNNIFQDLSFSIEDIYIGPNSFAVYNIFNKLAYEECLKFRMEYTSKLGGPHARYDITSRGRLIAKKVEGKLSNNMTAFLKDLSEIWHKFTLDSICKAALSHYARKYTFQSERIIDPIAISSSSVFYAPPKNLSSQANKLVKTLEEKFHFDCKVGKSQHSSPKYVPINLRINKNDFYKDLGNIPDEFGLGTFIDKSCEGTYIAYLYEDSTFMTYYSYRDFNTEKPSPLLTTQHFRNICKRVLGNIHLTAYTVFNPSFASLLGSSQFSYKEE